MLRPTLKTVAERARVSPATVSLVLSGRGRDHRISAATCERVTAVAARVGYVPNEQARRLKGRGVTTVGLVLPGLDNPHFARLAAAAEAWASARGWHLWIVDSREDAERERAQVASLVQRGVDGLIVAAVDPDLAVAAVPTIAIDRSPGAGWSAVTSDDRAATQHLCRALFAAGHFDRHSWFVGGDPGIATARERRAGFDRAARGAGLDPEGLVHHEGSFAPAAGAALVEAIVAAAPSGLFLASYTLLEGLLSAWDEGRCGRMPTLACFDDHPLLDHLRWPVSTVAPDHAALVAAAGSALAAWIDHDRPPSRHRRLAAAIRWRHPDPMPR